jgi:lipoprotein-releasing system permease protein
MNLPIRLARRYLFSRRSRNLIHLISGISMFVIAAVTAAMIAILSAFNGIEDVVSELFGTLDAELALIPAEGSTVPDSLGTWLDGQPAIARWAPVIEDEAVAQLRSGSPAVVSVLAFDTAFVAITPVESALRSGRWKESWNDMPAITLGLGVRNVLGATTRSDQASLVTLRAPIRGKSLVRSRERALRSVEAWAVDVFTINADLDVRYVLLPLGAGRELFDRPDAVSRFELEVAAGWEVDEAVRDLARQLPEGTRLRTRAEKNALITKTNRAEKWATFIILSFILVVAAFNIMASLTLLLLDKREDIAVLQAMGLTGARLEQAFSLQGLLINLIGGGVGLVVGTFLVLGQARFGWVKLEGSIVPAYPVRLALGDVLGTALVVTVVGGLGSALMVRLLIRRMTR